MRIAAVSLNEILGSALSGLTAAQAGMRATSNNIANVGTPGYARERISLSTGVTSGRTSGVVVGESSRVADRFLEATVYRRAGDMGRAEVSAGYLDRLQSLLGMPGADSGLPARLDAIAASAVAMTGSPSSLQTVAKFVADVGDAIGGMQQLDRDVSALRVDAESEVGYTVQQINGLLGRIHDLNDSVSEASGTGRSSAGAENQRMSAIEELSGLVKVTVREQADGRVTIDSASGAVLLDRRLRQLSYTTPGQGMDQPTYPTIDIRFADKQGVPGPATGDALDTVAIGGKLGGLLDLRDRALPKFAEKLGVLFGGLAEALNSVSNAGTTVPPPARLDGGRTALVGGDRFGFSGAATFAIAKADGTLVASARIDFAALGPGATVDDAVAAINAGLGGAGTAAFTDGRLTLRANGTGNGIVVAQDPANPSARAGVGFAQYFGLNDLVRSDASSLAPSGFVASDPHGFGAGEAAEIVLRDTSGRVLARHTLTDAAGPTFGDLVTQLNGSPLRTFGVFALDDRGRVRFAPVGRVAGAALSIPSDSTDRFGTGRSFSALSGLTGASSGLSAAAVRPDIVADAAKLPLARLQANAAVGTKALGAGDNRGANAFVERLGSLIDFGKDGIATADRFSSLLLGGAGTDAAQATDELADAAARRDDAVNRRDGFSGVNIDEELAQMVVLQNSYSAAARAMSTASDMYDTLLAMMN